MEHSYMMRNDMHDKMYTAYGWRERESIEAYVSACGWGRGAAASTSAAVLVLVLRHSLHCADAHIRTYLYKSLCVSELKR